MADDNDDDDDETRADLSLKYDAKATVFLSPQFSNMLTVCVEFAVFSLFAMLTGPLLTLFSLACLSASVI